MTSLRARLLLAASLVLAVFLLLAGASLERAFRGAAEQAQRDKMQGLVYALLGAGETGSNDQLTVPESALPDPRLARVQSGLEALIFNDKGKIVWHSPNFSGEMPKLVAPQIGAIDFRLLDERFALTYGIRWVPEETAGHPHGKGQRYTVAVLADDEMYQAQMQAFHRILYFGLGGSALALIVVQFFVLRWGLSPLRGLAHELRRIENGEQSHIESRYPDELTPLAEGLNAMIHAERTQQTRYRNALDDLAHSLKTPLAVLRGIIDDDRLNADTRARLPEPVSRIQGIVDHQLRKAAAAGRRTLAEPVAVRPIAEKIAAALGKVYAARQPQFQIEAAPALRVRADEGDLYELLGNLLDNAAKWCTSKIVLRIERDHGRLLIRIEDDGPGFPPAAAQLLERGARADTQTPGQGIGLGAAAEMARIYDGSIELSRSSRLGGAQVDVRLRV